MAIRKPDLDALEATKEILEEDPSQLKELRSHYVEYYGDETKLTDEELTNVLALADDDGDPEDWAKQIKAREDELAAEPAPAATE